MAKINLNHKTGSAGPVNLIFRLKKDRVLSVMLRRGRKVIDEESLTIGQGFDMLLIRTLDNIIVRNRIDRLSLKSIGMTGKIDGQASWGMILKTVRSALEN